MTASDTNSEFPQFINITERVRIEGKIGSIAWIYSPFLGCPEGMLPV